MLVSCAPNAPADGSPVPADLAFQTARVSYSSAYLQDLHPDWSARVQVGGRTGDLLIQQADERRAFVWQAGTWRYVVQAWGISLDDLLRIIAGLRIF